MLARWLASGRRGDLRFFQQLGTIRCVIFALWPHAVRVQPREHAVVLLWQYCLVVAALIVFG